MCVRATTASVRDASDPSVQVTGRRVRGLGCGSGSMLRVVLAAVMDCPESLTASESVALRFWPFWWPGRWGWAWVGL